jgi:hypothetical protein
MLADAPLESKLSISIVNHIVEPSNVDAAHMKKDAGRRDDGKENG